MKYQKGGRKWRGYELSKLIEVLLAFVSYWEKVS